MAVYKLKEVLDTRYLYISILKDFVHVITSVESIWRDSAYIPFAGNETQEKLFEDARSTHDITFDLFDMRITSDATPYLNTVMTKGFHFIDTGNAYRNSILLENEQRIINLDTVPLPAYDATKDPISYIGSLQKDVVYSLDANPSKLQLSLVILTSLMRPKIQFALDTIHGSIFDIVGEVITLNVLQKYNEFYYHTPEGIEVLHYDGKTVQTQRRGRCSLSEACEAGSVVPTAFGREKLALDPEWEPLIAVCLSVVNAVQQAKKTTLGEVLKGD